MQPIIQPGQPQCHPNEAELLRGGEGVVEFQASTGAHPEEDHFDSLSNFSGTREGGDLAEAGEAAFIMSCEKAPAATLDPSRLFTAASRDGSTLKTSIETFDGGSGPVADSPSHALTSLMKMHAAYAPLNLVDRESHSMAALLNPLSGASGVAALPNPKIMDLALCDLNALRRSFSVHVQLWSPAEVLATFRRHVRRSILAEAEAEELKWARHDDDDGALSSSLTNQKSASAHSSSSTKYRRSGGREPSSGASGMDPGLSASPRTYKTGRKSDKKRHKFHATELLLSSAFLNESDDVPTGIPAHHLQQARVELVREYEARVCAELKDIQRRRFCEWVTHQPQEVQEAFYAQEKRPIGSRLPSNDKAFADALHGPTTLLGLAGGSLSAEGEKEEGKAERKGLGSTLASHSLANSASFVEGLTRVGAVNSGLASTSRRSKPDKNPAHDLDYATLELLPPPHISNAFFLRKKDADAEIRQRWMGSKLTANHESGVDGMLKNLLPWELDISDDLPTLWGAIKAGKQSSESFCHSPRSPKASVTANSCSQPAGGAGKNSVKGNSAHSPSLPTAVYAPPPEATVPDTKETNATFFDTIDTESGQLLIPFPIFVYVISRLLFSIQYAAYFPTGLFTPVLTNPYYFPDAPQCFSGYYFRYFHPGAASTRRDRLSSHRFAKKAQNSYFNDGSRGVRSETAAMANFASIFELLAPPCCCLHGGVDSCVQSLSSSSFSVPSAAFGGGGGGRGLPPTAGYWIGLFPQREGARLAASGVAPETREQRRRYRAFLRKTGLTPEVGAAVGDLLHRCRLVAFEWFELMDTEQRGAVRWSEFVDALIEKADVEHYRTQAEDVVKRVRATTRKATAFIFDRYLVEPMPKPLRYLGYVGTVMEVRYSGSLMLIKGPNDYAVCDGVQQGSVRLRIVVRPLEVAQVEAGVGKLLLGSLHAGAGGSPGVGEYEGDRNYAGRPGSALNTDLTLRPWRRNRKTHGRFVHYEDGKRIHTKDTLRIIDWFHDRNSAKAPGNQKPPPPPPPPATSPPPTRGGRQRGSPPSGSLEEPPHDTADAPTAQDGITLVDAIAVSGVLPTLSRATLVTLHSDLCLRVYGMHHALREIPEAALLHAFVTMTSVEWAGAAGISTDSAHQNHSNSAHALNPIGSAGSDKPPLARGLPEETSPTAPPTASARCFDIPSLADYLLVGYRDGGISVIHLKRVLQRIPPFLLGVGGSGQGGAGTYTVPSDGIDLARNTLTSKLSTFETFRYNFHRSVVTSIRCLRGSSYCVTASLDGIVALSKMILPTSTRNGTEGAKGSQSKTPSTRKSTYLQLHQLRTISLCTSGIRQLATMDGSLFVVALSQSNRIIVCNVADRSSHMDLFDPLASHYSKIVSIVVVTELDQILTADSSGFMKVWSISHGIPIFSFYALSRHFESAGGDAAHSSTEGSDCDHDDNAGGQTGHSLLAEAAERSKRSRKSKWPKLLPGGLAASAGATGWTYTTPSTHMFVLQSLAYDYVSKRFIATGRHNAVIGNFISGAGEERAHSNRVHFMGMANSRIGEARVLLSVSDSDVRLWAATTGRLVLGIDANSPDYTLLDSERLSSIARNLPGAGDQDNMMMEMGWLKQQLVSHINDPPGKLLTGDRATATGTAAGKRAVGGGGGARISPVDLLHWMNMDDIKIPPRRLSCVINSVLRNKSLRYRGRYLPSSTSTHGRPATTGHSSADRRKGVSPGVCLELPAALLPTSSTFDASRQDGHDNRGIHQKLQKNDIVCACWGGQGRFVLYALFSGDVRMHRSDSGRLMKTFIVTPPSLEDIFAAVLGNLDLITGNPNDGHGSSAFPNFNLRGGKTTPAYPRRPISGLPVRFDSAETGGGGGGGEHEGGSSLGNSFGASHSRQTVPALDSLLLSASQPHSVVGTPLLMNQGLSSASAYPRRASPDAQWRGIHVTKRVAVVTKLIQAMMETSDRSKLATSWASSTLLGGFDGAYRGSAGNSGGGGTDLLAGIPHKRTSNHLEPVGLFCLEKTQEVVVVYADGVLRFFSLVGNNLCAHRVLIPRYLVEKYVAYASVSLAQPAHDGSLVTSARSRWLSSTYEQNVTESGKSILLHKGMGKEGGNEAPSTVRGAAPPVSELDVSMLMGTNGKGGAEEESHAAPRLMEIDVVSLIAVSTALQLVCVVHVRGTVTVLDVSAGGGAHRNSFEEWRKFFTTGGSTATLESDSTYLHSFATEEEITAVTFLGAYPCLVLADRRGGIHFYLLDGAILPEWFESVARVVQLEQQQQQQQQQRGRVSDSCFREPSHHSGAGKNVDFSIDWVPRGPPPAPFAASASASACPQVWSTSLFAFDMLDGEVMGASRGQGGPADSADGPEDGTTSGQGQGRSTQAATLAMLGAPTCLHFDPLHATLYVGTKFGYICSFLVRRFLRAMGLVPVRQLETPTASSAFQRSKASAAKGLRTRQAGRWLTDTAEGSELMEGWFERVLLVLFGVENAQVQQCMAASRPKNAAWSSSNNSRSTGVPLGLNTNERGGPGRYSEMESPLSTHQTQGGVLSERGTATTAPLGVDKEHSLLSKTKSMIMEKDIAWPRSFLWLYRQYPNLFTQPHDFEQEQVIPTFGSRTEGSLSDHSRRFSSGRLGDTSGTSSPGMPLTVFDGSSELKGGASQAATKSEWDRLPPPEESCHRPRAATSSGVVSAGPGPYGLRSALGKSRQKSVTIGKETVSTIEVHGTGPLSSFTDKGKFVAPPDHSPHVGPLCISELSLLEMILAAAVVLDAMGPTNKPPKRGLNFKTTDGTTLSHSVKTISEFLDDHLPRAEVHSSSTGEPSTQAETATPRGAEHNPFNDAISRCSISFRSQISTHSSRADLLNITTVESDEAERSPEGVEASELNELRLRVYAVLNELRRHQKSKLTPETFVHVPAFCTAWVEPLFRRHVLFSSANSPLVLLSASALLVQARREHERKWRQRHMMQTLCNFEGSSTAADSTGNDSKRKGTSLTEGAGLSDMPPPPQWDAMMGGAMPTFIQDALLRPAHFLKQMKHLSQTDLSVTSITTRRKGFVLIGTVEGSISLWTAYAGARVEQFYPTISASLSKSILQIGEYLTRRFQQLYGVAVLPKAVTPGNAEDPKSPAQLVHPTCHKSGLTSMRDEGGDGISSPSHYSLSNSLSPRESCFAEEGGRRRRGPGGTPSQPLPDVFRLPGVEVTSESAVIDVDGVSLKIQKSDLSKSISHRHASRRQNMPLLPRPSSRTPIEDSHDYLSFGNGIQRELSSLNAAKSTLLEIINIPNKGSFEACHLYTEDLCFMSFDIADLARIEAFDPATYRLAVDIALLRLLHDLCGAEQCAGEVGAVMSSSSASSASAGGGWLHAMDVRRSALVRLYTSPSLMRDAERQGGATGDDHARTAVHTMVRNLIDNVENGAGGGDTHGRVGTPGQRDWAGGGLWRKRRTWRATPRSFSDSDARIMNAALFDVLESHQLGEDDYTFFCHQLNMALVWEEDERMTLTGQKFHESLRPRWDREAKPTVGSSKPAQPPHSEALVFTDARAPTTTKPARVVRPLYPELISTTAMGILPKDLKGEKGKPLSEELVSETGRRKEPATSDGVELQKIGPRRAGTEHPPTATHSKTTTVGLDSLREGYPGVGLAKLPVPSVSRATDSRTTSTHALPSVDRLSETSDAIGAEPDAKKPFQTPNQCIARPSREDSRESLSVTMRGSLHRPTSGPDPLRKPARPVSLGQSLNGAGAPVSRGNSSVYNHRQRPDGEKEEDEKRGTEEREHKRKEEEAILDDTIVLLDVTSPPFMRNFQRFGEKADHSHPPNIGPPPRSPSLKEAKDELPKEGEREEGSLRRNLSEAAISPRSRAMTRPTVTEPPIGSAGGGGLAASVDGGEGMGIAGGGGGGGGLAQVTAGRSPSVAAAAAGALRVRLAHTGHRRELRSATIRHAPVEAPPPALLMTAQARRAGSSKVKPVDIMQLRPPSFRGEGFR